MQLMHTARKKTSHLLRAAVFGSALFLLCLTAPVPAVGVSLTVSPGVTVKGGGASQLVVRDTLIASKSTMTSVNVAPVPGDWLGLLVLGSATGTELLGTVIDFAGSGGGALDIRGVSPAIGGIQVRNSSGSGIKLSEGAAPAITDAVITGNSIGIETSGGALPTVHNSFLAGNSIAVQNLDPARNINATNNWWGHPSGPLDVVDNILTGGLFNPGGLGSPVSDYVGYSPWNTVIPVLGTSFTIAQGVMTEFPSITLNLSCISCTEFIASESPVFSGAAYQPMAAQEPFVLTTGDGLKTVYVRYRAGTGNTGGDTSAAIRLDTTGPSLSVTTPISGATVSRPTVVTAVAGDPAGVANVEFYIDSVLVASDTTSSYSYSWNVLSATDGGHELKTVAYDIFGHSTTDVRTVTVSKAPPSAPVITSPLSLPLTTKVVAVSGSAEPNISVSLFSNGIFMGQTVASAAGIFQFPTITLFEGANSLTAAASDSLGSSPKSAPVLVPVDTGPPKAPLFYTITAVVGGSIRLSWVPDSSEVPDHYSLYRSPFPFPNAGATLLSNALTTTSYSDTPAIDAQYFYGVTAFDATGNESALSTILRTNGINGTVDTVASAISDRTPPTAAVAFSPSAPVGPGTVGVTVTLSESLAAAPYLGIAPAGDTPVAIPLTSVTATEWTGSYVVTGATPHGNAAVVFAGKDSAGNKGSQITSGASLAIDTKGPSGALQFPPAVSLFKPGNVSLTLTLDEATLSAPTLQFTAPSGSVTTVTLTGSGTTWSGTLVVTSAMGDGIGTFAMSATDVRGTSGSILTAGNTLALDVTAPVAPTALAAVAASGGVVKLTWNTVADAVSYMVYRGANVADTAITLPSSLTSTNYTDVSLTVDGTYHYGVTAVDSAGNESILSNDVAVAADRLAPVTPTALTAQIQADKSVQLSWSAPTDGTAVSYRVYRSTTEITSVNGLTPLKTGVTTTATTDTPAIDGTYFYVVTALDAAGNESLPLSAQSLVYSLSPPRITVTGISDQQFSSTPVTPNVVSTSANITIPDVKLLDGAPFTNDTPVTAEGTHLLHVEATDNESRTTVKDVTFTIDLTDPLVTIANVVDGTAYETSVTPLITVSDLNLDRSIITLNGIAYVPGTPITTDGVNSILRVEAVDRAGRSTVAAVTFTINTAPPVPASLAVSATQGVSAALVWGASTGADLAGYLVYKNGVKLTAAPQTAVTYTDSTFDGTVLQTYEVSAIDTAGHESAKLRAEVLPVQIVMKKYGRVNGSGFILSKQFIESLTVDLVNGGSTAASVGPVSFELWDRFVKITETIQTAPITVAAGATVSSEKILVPGNDIADVRYYNVAMTLPADLNVTVKRVARFTLDAFDPGRKVEIFNGPIVKGELAKVQLKLFNHGSAPIELLTSSGGQATPDIYIELKDQDGNILVKGTLNQTGAGVINYSGAYALAEVPPGGSFLTIPMEILVPLTAPDTMYLHASVKSIYYHYKKPDQLIAGDFSGYTTVTAGLAPYSATIISDKPEYDQRLSSVENSPPQIRLSGSALSTADGTTPVPGVPVKIGIGVKGFARYLSATTNTFGNYSATFKPLVGEAGAYTLWATHPAVADKPIQSGFTIFGLSFDPGSVNLRMSKNSSFSMPIVLKNLGEAVLSGLQFVLNGGTGITGSLNLSTTATSIAGGKTTALTMTLDAALDAPDATSATITVTTAEGITRTLDVNIDLLAALPTIATDPGFIEAGVNRNSSKVVTFKLKNVGYAPLQNIVIQPPALPWIGLLSATTLPDLAPGASTDISVNFRPTDLVAQGGHADKLVITSGNHVPYTLNLFPTVISTNKGSVHFQIIDTLAKKVAGANVAISHQQLGSVYLTGTADINGEASFVDIVEGMYNYKIQAPGHEVVIGTFEILPGAVLPINTIMNNVFVTFDWSVTPMTLVDKYDIKLEATFETQVPAPVITIDPAYERLELEIGSTYVGEYRVTNHGLVALDDAKFGMAGAPGLRVESLITELPRIGAKETIIVPYRITVNPFKSPEPVEGCSTLPVTINVGGGYTCMLGITVGGGAMASRTIIPRERYDLLGLCDVKCDWCKCAPPAAQGLCNCIKTMDPCVCLGLSGIPGAEMACGCASAANPVGCMASAAAAAVTDEIRSRITNLIPVVGQAAAALDAAKNIVSCLLCVMELLPAIPSSPTTYSGTYGGGTYGGMGSVAGSGVGFSSSRVCR